MSDPQRALLKRKGLRVTAPRLAVLELLSDSGPLSHSEVLDGLGTTRWDQATIYRNLVRLTEVGITRVVSRADGMARYALIDADDAHQHPHFLCEDCGRVSCLPGELRPTTPLAPKWAESVRTASVQLRGACPDCLSRQASS